MSALKKKKNTSSCCQAQIMCSYCGVLCVLCTLSPVWTFLSQHRIISCFIVLQKSKSVRLCTTLSLLIASYLAASNPISLCFPFWRLSYIGTFDILSCLIILHHNELYCEWYIVPHCNTFSAIWTFIASFTKVHLGAIGSYIVCGPDSIIII